MLARGGLYIIDNKPTGCGDHGQSNAAVPIAAQDIPARFRGIIASNWCGGWGNVGFAFAGAFLLFFHRLPSP
jgi:hypothetical protein